MNDKESNKRNTFTGSIGFVLAAAGSAVGLGNIWRFPYLAARDGGGLFLVINLIMPVISIGTCILIGWILKPKVVLDEVTKNGEIKIINQAA